MEDNSILVYYVSITGYAILSYVLAIVVILVTIPHILVPSILMLKHNGCKSLLELFTPTKEKSNNYLQLVVFVSAIIFSIMTIITTATNGCCGAATWHIGLFTIILIWTNLIRLLSKLPIIGEHVIVFFDIVWTFLQLTIFAILLVLAATIVLSMTFYDVQALVG